MKRVNIASALFFMTTLLSCDNSVVADLADVSIVKQPPETQLALSEIMIPVKSIVLQDIPPDELRSIEDIVIAPNDHVMVLDNRHDFQNVYLFDQSGKFLNQIGKQGGGRNEYDGLNGICMLNDEITLLASSRRAFYNYKGSSYEVPTIIPNGMIGDMVARDDEGYYYVYNEHSGTELSGMHYILVYDKVGNLINRLFPYTETRENQAYGYTGFMRKSGDNVWFSPPFDNTVYMVDKNSCTATYNFDFGNAGVTRQQSDNKIKGDALSASGFLNEWFLVHGNIIQFEYQLENKVYHGFYDTSSGKFFNSHSFRKDELSELYSRGTVMPKDEKSFLLVLSEEQTNQLQKRGKAAELEEQLNNLYPGLGSNLVYAGANHLPLVIEFKYKPKVVLE